MTTSPRIAIAGAGPGGLTCARVLQRHGVPVTVLDREASPDVRPQGGTLDMHADSGQVALAAAGLLDEFLAMSRPEGQEMRVLDSTGTELFRHAPGADELYDPEIDRGDLRRLLLDSLRPGTVSWGRTVRAVDTGGRVRFADGSTEEFDLVIGADGAWSKVRPALSDAVPAYTGVTFVEIGFSDADTRHAGIAELVGDGTMMALGDNKGLIGQRSGNDHIRIYVAFRRPEDWYRAAGIDLADREAVRAHLLELFTGWDERLLAMLRDNEGFVNRPLYALPVPHVWTHSPAVTLLGDAAHLMSPFSGMGANLAMLDGAELARAIVEESDLDSAVHKYEAVLHPRSTEVATAAAEGLDNAISPSAPEHTLNLMREIVG